MPDRLSYNQAILLSEACLKIQDPDLKKGRVELITISANVQSFKLPWGVQGSFAIVYKFRTQSGKPRALRCFLKPVDAETEFRYQRIGPYFHTHIPEITAGFYYHNPGIAVREGGKADPTSYPILEMEWIEGKTLFDEVNDLCTKGDRQALNLLTEQWLELLHKLRQAQIAHGDLAAVNVMVRENGRLVLIDYDGVYIPEFAGLRALQNGQADYQHPQMQNRLFDEHMDDFSALVIYVALLALSLSPELWNKYMKRDAKQGKPLDTNLLFLASDFRSPDRSPLMQELLHFQDQRMRDVTQELLYACQQPVNQVTFPYRLIDPEYEKKQAIKRLQAALKGRDITAIADAYRPEQAFFQTLPQEEQREAQAIHGFVHAAGGSDDQAIFTAYQAVMRLPGSRSLIFSPAQQQRVAIARERVEALASFRQAIGEKSPRKMVNAYRPVLDGLPVVTREERELLALGRRFIQAYDADSDAELVAIQQTMLSSPYFARFVLTSAEEKRLADAVKRIETLNKFRAALQQRRPDHIRQSYDPVISKAISQDELLHYSLACRFLEAYRNDDDTALFEVEQELGKQHIAFAFTSDEQERIVLASRRIAALAKFRAALRAWPQQAQQLLLAYDPVLLDESKSLTKEERSLLEDARNYLQMYAQVCAAIRADDDHALRQAYNKRLDQLFTAFTETERQRIQKANRVLEVKELLDGKQYEQAIKLARSFVVETRQEIDASLRFGLQVATRRFIRERNITSLHVQIEEDTWEGINYAKADWRWPENELVQQALLVWRTDTWPQRPGEKAFQDAEWHHLEVRRDRFTGEGELRFPIGRHYHIFVRVFACILDEWEYEYREWRYADGNEPSSQCEAGGTQIPWRTFG